MNCSCRTRAMIKKKVSLSPYSRLPTHCDCPVRKKLEELAIFKEKAARSEEAFAKAKNELSRRQNELSNLQERITAGQEELDRMQLMLQEVKKGRTDGK